MTLTVQFEKALTLATRLHATQTRKGTAIPYIAHLLGVASIALDHGANEDEAIAALLHDAVEDQGGEKTLNHIRRHFGSTVAAIVWGCSDYRRSSQTTVEEAEGGVHRARCLRVAINPAGIRLGQTAQCSCHPERLPLGGRPAMGPFHWRQGRHPLVLSRPG